MANTLKSIYGRLLGIASSGQLVSNGIDISRPCVGATITVGAEAADVRAITVQLTDANGAGIDYVETVEVFLFLDAAQAAFAATGGSTGIEIGTDGALQTVIAKKQWVAMSEADGDIDLTWTDTGTEVAFLGIRLPNGLMAVSDALTNA